MKTIFVSGTNGLPGRYGGWDPLLNTLPAFLARAGSDVVVHTESSKKGEAQSLPSRRIQLSYIPYSANGVSSIIYDFFCLLEALRAKGVVIMLGTSGGIFFPFFRLLGLPIIVNLDGEEWKRSKWSLPAKLFLFVSDFIALKSASAVIADHPLIYSRVASHRRSQVYYIPYGVDHVAHSLDTEEENTILRQYGLIRNKYFFKVCRIEPENSIEIILKAFADPDMPMLVLMGNWNNSSFGIRMREAYSSCSNILMLDACYDQMRVNALRTCSTAYIHGHTVGGTNPSLLEALAISCFCIVNNNLFNTIVAGSSCDVFDSVVSLREVVKKTMNIDYELLSGVRLASSRRVSLIYDWSAVCTDYHYVLENVAS